MSVQTLTELTQIRSSLMDAQGTEVLRLLGRQLDAHLTSLQVLQGATQSLAVHCSDMVVEIAKLLDAIQTYQSTHAEVLTQADNLRRIVRDFAQYMHISGFPS